MNLIKKKLDLLWDKKKNIESERVVEVLKSLNSIDSFDESSVRHTEGFYGPAKDCITRPLDDDGRKSIAIMKIHFDVKYDEYIDAVCNIVNTPHGRDKYYKVFSNDDNKYFISNNYFYNIIEFIKKSKNEDTFNNLVGEDKIPLVLGCRYKYYYEDINKEINILSKQFITKYLWMLGNRKEVLSVYSLQSFWSIKNAGLFKEFNLDIKDDTDFDTFTKAWRVFSQEVFDALDISTSKEKLNFSKWLFAVSINDKMDIKNISDLLTTGTKAVILCGPPSM